MKERLCYVDIAKGIGLLLVVCSHSDAFDLMWLMMDMCIPLFFFCSGYTFRPKSSFSEEIIKKARKLLLPYLFFNFIMLCIFGHFSLRELVGIVYSRYSLYPIDVAPNIKFFTSGNYPMWYLTGMFISYFLFLLIIYYENVRRYIVMAYFILIYCFLQLPILLPWSIDTAPLSAMVIYVGMKVREKNYISISGVYVFLLLLFYIGLRLVSGNLNISVRIYGTSFVVYFLLAISASYIVVWGSKYLQGTVAGKCFMTLGQHSLTIFCIEIAFIVLAKKIWCWLIPESELGYMAGIFEIIFTLLGGLIVSILLHKIEPIKRYIF